MVFLWLWRVGATLVAAHGLLIAVASLVAEHGLEGAWASVVVAHRLSCSEARGISLDREIWGTMCIWSHGDHAMCPTLAGGFLSTAPQGRSRRHCCSS